MGAKVPNPYAPSLIYTELVGGLIATAAFLIQNLCLFLLALAGFTSTVFWIVSSIIIIVGSLLVADRIEQTACKTCKNTMTYIETYRSMGAKKKIIWALGYPILGLLSFILTALGFLSPIIFGSMFG